MSFEIALIGSGPLESSLRSMADEILPGRVHWLGQRPMGEIPALMVDADCLVLPSRYDGWGAVISEALMSGTPAICSDTCGAADAVRASGAGGVFRSGDAVALSSILRQAILRGQQTKERRANLSAWAHCLGGQAGADYLNSILSYSAEKGTTARPFPPWGVPSALEDT